MTPTDHGALVRAAAAGDAEATSAVLELCYDELRAIAARRMGRLVREREATLDIVQSVCREFVERAPSAVRHDPAQAIRWLSRGIEHKIIAKYRYYTAAKRDVRAEVESLLVRAEVEAEDFDPALELASDEARRAVAELLLTLGERARRVLELRIAGRTPGAIARELGCPEGTVRSDLSRARAELARRRGSSGGAD